jgi:hypothetical protein
MSQLTWITEGSTFFVNYRQLLAWHNYTETPLYVANGALMALSFFVFRIVFYTLMILFNVLPFCLDQDGTNWIEYPTATM